MARGMTPLGIRRDRDRGRGRPRRGVVQEMAEEGRNQKGRTHRVFMGTSDIG